MNALIELYDERAIENVLAADMFRPQRIVYLCPTEVAQTRERQKQIGDFFRHRGWNPELIFVETSLYKVDRIVRQLMAISEKYPDCAMDVTGGSDAELFAAGMFASQALELYVYKACLDTGIFNDIIISAIVRWNEVLGHGSVINEIDVMATRGVVPLFISCKVSDIKTEALNELAILRDRFGGKGAKAAIVSTGRCNAAARHRAAQLGIAVIDRDELETGKLAYRLKVIMKVDNVES